MEKRFSEKKEALEFFREQKASDTWTRLPLSRVVIDSLPNSPVTASVMTEYGMSAEELISCMKKDLVFTVHNADDFTDRKYVCRDTANRTIYDRAMVNGRIFKILPYPKTTAFINDCYTARNKALALMLIRDNQVSAIHGGGNGDYAILPVYDLLDAIDNYFTDCEFVNACFTHEVSTALFTIKDNKYINHYNELLKKYGLTAINGSCEILLRTSDVSTSSVQIVPTIRTCSGTLIPYGTPIGLAHKNNATISDFKDKLALVDASLNNVDKIERLLNIHIKHPVDVFRKICAMKNLPKQAALSVADTMLMVYSPNHSITAYEVYLSLYDIVDILKHENTPAQRIIAIEESISRVLNLKDWHEIDHKFEWL